MLLEVTIVVSLVEGNQSEMKKAQKSFCSKYLILTWVLVIQVFQLAKMYLNYLYIYINIYTYMGSFLYLYYTLVV